MSFKKGINIISWAAGILAGLTALACIVTAFVPSIDFNDEKMEEVSPVSFFAVNYINHAKVDEIIKEEEAAEKNGGQYSYRQNFVEFAIQNFNSMYHEEAYKKINKTYSGFSEEAEPLERLATESRDYTVRGIITLMMLGIPLLLLSAGAVMAFLQKSGAAEMLLVGGVAFVAVSVYWMLFIHNMVPLGRVFFMGGYANTGVFEAQTGKLMTAAPVLMVVFGALTIAEAVGLMVIHRLKERG